jgi:hypothetical protein
MEKEDKNHKNLKECRLHIVAIAMASTVYIVGTETSEMEDIKLFSDLKTAQNYVSMQSDAENFFICHYTHDSANKEYEMTDLSTPDYTES